MGVLPLVDHCPTKERRLRAEKSGGRGVLAKEPGVPTSGEDGCESARWAEDD